MTNPGSLNPFAIWTTGHKGALEKKLEKLERELLKQELDIISKEGEIRTVKQMLSHVQAKEATGFNPQDL